MLNITALGPVVGVLEHMLRVQAARKVGNLLGDTGLEETENDRQATSKPAHLATLSFCSLLWKSRKYLQYVGMECVLVILRLWKNQTD